jgi:hypothetical protein
MKSSLSTSGTRTVTKHFAMVAPPLHLHQDDVHASARFFFLFFWHLHQLDLKGSWTGRGEVQKAQAGYSECIYPPAPTSPDRIVDIAWGRVPEAPRTGCQITPPDPRGAHDGAG